MNTFAITEQILRNRIGFFEEIRDQIDLNYKIRSLLISTFIALATYGFVMGINHSIAQALSSTIKLPMLFLLTLLICTPSLHILNLVFGSKKTLSQTIALILAAMNTSAILLMSLMPVTLFFFLSTSDYIFFKLLNVAFFTFAGILGMVFLWQGVQILDVWDDGTGRETRRAILRGWIVLYAFVGSQMAWTLRPFMGIPGKEFILFSQRGGNLYTDVVQSIMELLGV
jgi:hypothetical protein